MDYNYTRILIDIDNSLRELNKSIRQASKPQPNQTKADFILEVAPKIALAIAPSGKADFPSVIQLASSWYNDIEEYISDMDSKKQTEYSSVVFPQENSEAENKDKKEFNKAIADIF